MREFLRELLDFFTHLGNFPPPVDPRLITTVTAGKDAYVPRDGVVPLDVVFPNSEIRFLPQSGHVSTHVRNYLWNQDFRYASFSMCLFINNGILLSPQLLSHRLVLVNTSTLKENFAARFSVTDNIKVAFFSYLSLI